MEHKCNLNDGGEFCWSDLIGKDIKQYEVRANAGKWKNVEPGHKLIFNCFGNGSTKILECEVTHLLYFKNFGEAFKNLDLK